LLFDTNSLLPYMGTLHFVLNCSLSAYLLLLVLSQFVETLICNLASVHIRPGGPMFSLRHLNFLITSLWYISTNITQWNSLNSNENCTFTVYDWTRWTSRILPHVYTMVRIIQYCVYIRLQVNRKYNTTHVELPNRIPFIEYNPGAYYLLFSRPTLTFYSPKLVLFVFIRNQLCKAVWDPIVCKRFICFRLYRSVF
jgi:hypothetical protein